MAGITAQYLGQRCRSLFGPSPRRGPWESSGRPPGGLSHSGPGSKTPSPRSLPGALRTGRSYLREARWRNCERLHPHQPLGFVCLTQSRRPQTQKHLRTLLFFFWHKCLAVVDILTQIQNNVSFLSEVGGFDVRILSVQIIKRGLSCRKKPLWLTLAVSQSCRSAKHKDTQ